MTLSYKITYFCRNFVMVSQGAFAKGTSNVFQGCESKYDICVVHPRRSREMIGNQQINKFSPIQTNLCQVHTVNADTSMTLALFKMPTNAAGSRKKTG